MPRKRPVPKGQRPTEARLNEDRLVPDIELAPMMGVSVGYLRKDRITDRKIPYIQLGALVRYHPPTVRAALLASCKQAPG